MAQVTCRRKGVLRRHRTPPQLRAAGNRPPSRGPRVCVKLSLVSVVCASRGCVRIWGRERALTRYPEPSHGRPRGPGPAQRVNNRRREPRRSPQRVFVHGHQARGRHSRTGAAVQRRGAGVGPIRPLNASVAYPIGSRQPNPETTLSGRSCFVVLPSDTAHAAHRRGIDILVARSGFRGKRVVGVFCPRLRFLGGCTPVRCPRCRKKTLPVK